MKKETEEGALRIKESSQAGTSGKGLQKPNHVKGEEDCNIRHGLARGSTNLNLGSKEETSRTQPIIGISLDNWDITGLLGSELLSDTVRLSYHYSISICLDGFVVHSILYISVL